MTDDFKMTDVLLAAVGNLSNVATQEGVPDPGEGYRGFVGWTSDLRRVLYVLNRVAAHVSHLRQEGQSDAMALEEAVVQQEPPPPAPLSAAPAGPDIVKFVPAEEFEAPSRVETVPMTSKIPPPNPAVGADSSTAEPSHAVAAPPVQPLVPPFHQPVPAVHFPQTGGAFAEGPRPAPLVKPAMPPIEMVKKTVYLKNAKANEVYEGAVEIEGLKDVRLENAGGSGLILDPSSGLLKGVPVTSGDFVLRLQGLLHGKRCEVTANLAVIADPKSLWISKDSDRNDPFWKPDEAFRRVEGDLLCVAASKRGRSHAKDGGFRDDDFGLLAQGTGGWHIAVVADGAGSAKYSRRGSKVAVDSVLQELPGLLAEHVTPHLAKLVTAYQQGNPHAAGQIKRQLYEALATAAFNAAKAIEEEAVSHGTKASAFSTTLIMVVARQIPEGWFIAGFSVGDGGAAVFDIRDGSLTPLTLPDNGEFAGQTRFLQRSEFAVGFDEVTKRIFFDIRKAFTAIALMTDGISDPKFPTDAVFADPGRWGAFWNDDLTKAVDFSRANDAMETQFLEWLDFWSPGNHDDRTLAILVP